MEKTKSIRIAESVWRPLKQRALDESTTMRVILEGLCRTYLAGSTVHIEKPVKLAARPVVETAKAPDMDVMCVCGQYWRNHQSGESKQVAIVTNCRHFVPMLPS